MPELPEVETVKETLKKQLLHCTIKKVSVHYPNIVAFPEVSQFEEKLLNQQIIDMKRRGKWLLFELNDDYLLSHLRMEGKYFFRNPEDPLSRHEHVSFLLDDGRELRYQDTRKFGRMYLIPKEKLETVKPLCELGLEPWDTNLTVFYLKERFHKKEIPIKTALLDQSIIAGIGNIYDDEILFMSHINPLKKACKLTKKELQDIIDHTRVVLEKAILAGGTTIHSFESSEGVHGRFQHELMIHGKEKCSVCGSEVTKIQVNGRGTYYCKKCQK